MGENRENRIFVEIISAMKSLGYNIDLNDVCIHKVAFNRYKVELCGSSIGIYDIFRHTFVD